VKYVDPDSEKIFDARWWRRNAGNLLSLTLSGVEVAVGFYIKAATGVTGVGLLMSRMMIAHGSLNIATKIGKIATTTIAADLYGDDYADDLNRYIPNTTLGVALWSIGLAAEALTGFSYGNTAEKAGAIGDLLDIAVGMGISFSTSRTLVREINNFVNNSKNLFSRTDLIKLQQYAQNANKIGASKLLQGLIENMDRINGYVNVVDRLTQ